MHERVLPASAWSFSSGQDAYLQASYHYPAALGRLDNRQSLLLSLMKDRKEGGGGVREMEGEGRETGAEP